MIARTSPCDRDRLGELLADRLSPKESEELTDHLERCGSCRRYMESLAGGSEDWTAVREALSASGLGAASLSGKTPGESRETTGEFGWVRSLLQPGAAGELGRLGRYPVRGVIGRGGMGVVLRAYDEELNRPLAIKLLAPHLASTGAARKRFLREAQAAAAVVHPGVVPIYSVMAEARVPYLVMPYIGGGNLQQRIDRDGPLELDDLLRIGLQIAEGLAAAHRQGLVHRDIKPANVLIEEGGHRVLISDFGLARALDDASLTASGMIAGTPSYMSPEQAHGEMADCRSDLFSLGSLLYAMATGRPPFRGDSALAVLRQIGEKPVTPIRQINERMPAWFDQFVGRLMSRTSTDRPATAEIVVQWLQQCLGHVRAPASEPLPREIRSARRFRRWPTAAIATVVATVAAIVALGPWGPEMEAVDPANRGVAITEEPAATEATVLEADPAPTTTPPFTEAIAPQTSIDPPDLAPSPDPVDQEIERLRVQIQQLRSAVLEDQAR